MAFARAMKPWAAVLLLLLTAVPSCTAGSNLLSRSRGNAGAAQASSDDRTITKVVKLLQDLLDKSKTEGEEERTIYAKFKCYCDEEEDAKVKSIEDLTKEIELLKSKIDAILAETGSLSSEVASLKTAMDENVAARTTADGIRAKEKQEYDDLVLDLGGAVTQLTDAINVLAEVGADQTRTEDTGAADHHTFMGGYTAASGASLLRLKDQVHIALKAASAFMTPKQETTVAAFMQQAPFTGTYTSQSAEVLGILKSMKETFDANLKEADEKEQAAIKAHADFIKEKEDAWDDLDKLYKEKQSALGTNDGDLSDFRLQLEAAETQKASDEAFLASLRPMCAEKAKGYQERKVLRAQEEAAIAEAISILNSDAAFETFGKVDATKSGATSFVQLSSIKRHEASEDATRDQLKQVLGQAAKKHHSVRAAKVLSMVVAKNPFNVVLVEIQKMLDLLVEEGKVDQQNFDWCKKERKVNRDNLGVVKDDILRLEGEIFDQHVLIDDDETGLKKQISDVETTLLQNHDSQVEETSTRRKENVAYQKDISNIVEAEALLGRAIKVLKKYYDELAQKLAADAGAALVQKEEPTPPEAWKGDGAYKGQGEKGSDAISMLEFILSETEKEEMMAHQTEQEAQHSYEDSMIQLKEDQATEEKNLADLNDALAQAEKELVQMEADYEAAVKERDAIEAYLLRIKPGCDFITDNKADRDNNRDIEKQALLKAKGFIEGSPAYIAAVNEQKVADFGACKDTCVKDEEHVQCQACLAKVSMPGYCAGHPDTKGCEGVASTPAPVP